MTLKEKSKRLQGVFERWTPACSKQIQKDIPYTSILNPHIDYSKKKLFPQVGAVHGGLTVIDYADDKKKPLGVKCCCGRRMPMSVDDFYAYGTCGCFQNMLRLYYIARLRIETVISWVQNIPRWINDMEIMEDYVNTLVENNDPCKGEIFRLPVNTYQPKRGSQKLLRRELSEHNLQFLDFISFIKLPKSRKETILNFVGEILKASIWDASPLCNSETIEGDLPGIPEFDREVFKTLIELASIHKKEYQEYNE